jgi:Cu(I)/Ag(I) efflux system periplasmic protein CusF
MKHIAVFAAVLIAAAPTWAQQGGMGGMGMKDKGGPSMDMGQCKEMMDKGRMDMPKECKDMLEKQGQGAKGKSGAKSSDKKAQAKLHKGSGIVTSIDTAAGKVTIEHGPVRTLNWPAMSMTFGVKDKSMLDHVHQGDKVEFEFVQQGPDYVITRIH